MLIAADMALSVYDVPQLTLAKSLKLSVSTADVERVRCLHLVGGLVALCSEQAVVRLFDVVRNENYVLSLTDARHMAAPNDTVDALHFMAATRVLVGVTAKHRVVQWKLIAHRSGTSEHDWLVLPPIAVARPVRLLCAPGSPRSGTTRTAWASPC